MITETTPRSSSTSDRLWVSTEYSPTSSTSDRLWVTLDEPAESFLVAADA